MQDTELTDVELDELRGSLLALRVDLEQLLVSSQESAHAVELDQSKVGRLSRMDAMQQQAMAVAKRSTYQNQLREVIKAIGRIERDEYGYCVACDSPIPVARLRIKPDATLCLGCQQSQGG